MVLLSRDVKDTSTYDRFYRGCFLNVIGFLLSFFDLVIILRSRMYLLRKKVKHDRLQIYKPLLFGQMIFFSTTTHLSTLSWTCLSTVTYTTNVVVKDFFIHLFYHPGQHYEAIMSMGIAAIGLCVGTAFLVKFIYEKVHPAPTIDNSKRS